MAAESTISHNNLLKKAAKYFLLTSHKHYYHDW